MIKQVSLIALYGKKSLALANLIIQCQEIIAAIPDIEFMPYNLSQIHATFVGLEKVIGTPLNNLNLNRYQNRSEKMDIYGFLNFLRTSDYLPLQVQLGGFEDSDYPFTSRQQKPFDRSFAIQGDKAVLMGWPVAAQFGSLPIATNSDLLKETPIYPNILDQLRKASQSFNILHTYHRTPTDIDNDFYFRIGLINPETLDSSSKLSLENSIKEFLSSRVPLLINIRLIDLFLAAYDNETLPLNSTKIWSLQDKQLTQEFIENLYN